MVWQSTIFFLGFDMIASFVSWLDWILYMWCPTFSAIITDGMLAILILFYFSMRIWGNCCYRWEWLLFKLLFEFARNFVINCFFEAFSYLEKWMHKVVWNCVNVVWNCVMLSWLINYSVDLSFKICKQVLLCKKGIYKCLSSFFLHLCETSVW